MKRRAAEPLLDELLLTLRAEQQALVRGDTDPLPALASAKSQAFENLSAVLREAPRGAPAHLADALSTARRINDINAALITARMAVNRARLDTLLSLAGHATGAGVYGARGELPPLSSSTTRAAASA